MDTNKTVVVPARKAVLTVEEIENLRNKARSSIRALTRKPTLQEMYAQVDSCWSNPVFVKNTVFKNKEQHYDYITTYYKEKIEKLTLEEYKKLVYADVCAKLDSAKGLVEAEKIALAAKEHKKQQEAHLKAYQDQIDALKKRNDEVNTEVVKQLSDTEILGEIK